mmetsp:Transcript_4841/g.16179  ORF Transcript_4841/g.16179 Transcript_4841/m.16179 type:complete len:463 (+) Transcript_4841:2320-3708(+)
MESSARRWSLLRRFVDRNALHDDRRRERTQAELGAGARPMVRATNGGAANDGFCSSREPRSACGLRSEGGRGGLERAAAGASRIVAVSRGAHSEAPIARESRPSRHQRGGGACSTSIALSPRQPRCGIPDRRSGGGGGDSPLGHVDTSQLVAQRGLLGGTGRPVSILQRLVSPLNGSDRRRLRLRTLPPSGARLLDGARAVLHRMPLQRRLAELAGRHAPVAVDVVVDERVGGAAAQQLHLHRDALVRRRRVPARRREAREVVLVDEPARPCRGPVGRGEVRLDLADVGAPVAVRVDLAQQRGGGGEAGSAVEGGRHRRRGGERGVRVPPLPAVPFRVEVREGERGEEGAHVARRRGQLQLEGGRGGARRVVIRHKRLVEEARGEDNRLPLLHRPLEGGLPLAAAIDAPVAVVDEVGARRDRRRRHQPPTLPAGQLQRDRGGAVGVGVSKDGASPAREPELL